MVLTVLPLLATVIGFAVAAPALERWSVQQRMRAIPPVAFDPGVVLVGVGPSMTEGLPNGAVVPRAHLAEVLDALVTLGPAVVALDYRMGQKESRLLGFDQFRMATQRADSEGVEVVLPSTVGEVGTAFEVTYGPDTSLTTVRTGYVTFQPEPLAPLAGRSATGAPSFLRMTHVRSLIGGDFAMSLPLVTVAAARGMLPAEARARRSVSPLIAASVADRVMGIRQNEQAEALNEAMRPQIQRFAAPYRAPQGALTYVASDELISEGGRLPREWFEGRIVVVAEVSPSTDRLDSAELPYGVVRGGVLLVHAIDTLLSGDGLREIPTWLAWLLGVLALVLGYALGSAERACQRWTDTTLWAVGGALVAWVYVWIATALMQAGVVVPVVGPLAMGLGGATIGFVIGRPALQQGGPSGTVRPEVGGQYRRNM